VIATDAEGRVEIVNPVAQTLTGMGDRPMRAEDR